jgi:O-antigen/teichoic acid export membrane protein
MAAVFSRITVLITDLGTGEALILHQKADKVLESSVFWLNMGVATFIAGLLLLISPFIADLYGQSIVSPIVNCLSLVLVVQSLSLVQVSLLKKHRNFKAIAFAEIMAQIGGAFVAITLALYNFGVWALVGYSISKALFYTTVIWILSDWTPRFCFNKAKISIILSFSVNSTIVKFLNYIERNSDKLIIGYFQGPMALGLYSRAYTSFNQIIKLINGFYNPVFYSILTKELDDKDYIKKIFLLSCQSLIYLFVPVTIILMILSNDLVRFIFGPQWLEMAPILQVLGGICIVKPIHN